MENSLILVGGLLLSSVLFSKISDKFSIPALLIFLSVGMLAGSDGLVGIHFDNEKIAQDVGVIALIFILFAGGLDTVFKEIKPILKDGILLATFGVVLTAGVVGVFAHYVMGFSWYESMLVGAIISSTDAAAVFAILRSKGIKLKNNLRPLLELESGSNDPMAIFLTITIIQMMTLGVEPSVFDWIYKLFFQFGVGGLFGYIAGRLLPTIFNRINLGYWGLYPVLSIAWVLLLFAISSKVGANGYIAVYIAGIFANKKEFAHKRNLIGFHDGIAWMMQIVIFVTLGLLVFPSELPSVALKGFVLAIFLILIARPIGVFTCMIFSKYKINEKMFVSWVGLRGVVPIILATYPFASNVENSQLIFNIIFFVVLASVLVQGTTLGIFARFFNVQEEGTEELENTPFHYNLLKQFSVLADSDMIAKNLAELELPESFIVLLVKRKGEYILPSGSIVFEENDLLLVHCDDLKEYKKTIKLLAKKDSNE